VNPNTAVVLVAIIGIVVPVLTLVVKFLQDRSLGRDAAAARRGIAESARLQANQAAAATVAVEKVRTDLADQSAGTQAQLAVIHELVNSRLSRLLAVNEEMRLLLVEWAPNDPRVRALNKEDAH
jgi:hypothetical protein